ncbi:MAG: hypothetical protein PHE54_04560, partial [Bacilli bacterium]|nr:hypothetical protein [Bacilli bacterium]
MKRNIFLLLLIISLTVQCGVVNALEGDANTVGGNINKVDTKYGNYWSGYEGIRVYVVDTSGKLKSDVVDYSNYSGLSSYKHGGKKTKFDYQSSSLSISSSTYKYSDPIKYIPSFIGSSNSSVIYNYFMSMASDTNDQIVELLLDLNFQGDVTAIAENSYYLVVEPIAYFTYNFTNYALTATETALLLERSEANTPYNINNNGFCVSCI